MERKDKRGRTRHPSHRWALLGAEEEGFNHDTSRPRKVHGHCKWKPHQDAVHWIHLANQKGWLRGRYRLGHRPVVLEEVRRPKVQSGPRKDKMYRSQHCLAERSRPWSWALKRCCGKRVDPWKRSVVSTSNAHTGGKMVAPGCASKRTKEPTRSSKITRGRTQRNHQKRKEKVGSSNACGNAVQKGNKEDMLASGNWSAKLWIQQDSPKNKACMYCGGARVHETTFEIISSKRSWRSHRRQRIQFDESLKFSAQIYSDASSDENSGWEFPVYNEWKKLETIPAWQLDKV